jgi:putative ABC transport system permease protein
MSLNVIERTREIGVMRAIGASDWAVRQIFVVEGALTAILSWAAGALIALPLSRLLSDQVGLLFIEVPLSYSFSLTSVLLWLVLAIVLGVLASLGPAWHASRLTVHEVLAYE